MRQAIPPMTEQATELKQRRQRAPDSHQQRRLQRRSRLASGQAHDRQDVAHLLGGQRHTIGRRLARYAARGLPALLATDAPAGQPLSLAPAGLASLAPALPRPAGFASDEALRQEMRQPPGGEVQGKTLYPIVRTRFRTRLKVPRPSPTKKP